jgi:hypothetical protein
MEPTHLALLPLKISLIECYFQNMTCILFCGSGVWSQHALLFEPHLQTIFLWVFWRWGSHKVFACAGIKLWPSLSQSPSSQDHRHEPLVPSKPLFVCLCVYLVWQHWGFTSTPQANYLLSQFFSFFYVGDINKLYFIFYKLFIRVFIIWED